MTEPFKILTWNLHCASAASEAWEYLLELDPDVALLQEVGPVPLEVAQKYECLRAKAMGITALQRFHTAILVRGEIGPAIPLTGPRPWIDGILAAYASNLLAHEVYPRSGPPLKVMSVYSPPWQVPERFVDAADLDALQRTQQRGVWLTDVLLAALEHDRPDHNERWIIAGDLNLSESFDRDRRFAGGNGAWLHRMAGLGLTECLRKAKGAATPTFRHSRGGIWHQMDHLFVTESLAPCLVTCETGSQERVFARPALSDHLPLVATFAL